MNGNSTPDTHAVCRRKMDEALAASPNLPDDAVLREHLRTCEACGEYLERSTRAIAGLGGFSFAVDPALQASVFAALELRAQQLEVASPDRRHIAWACALAVLFAVAGSVLDLRFGDLLALPLHLSPADVRHSLLELWVLPSLLPLLFFPFLPALAGRKARLL